MDLLNLDSLGVGPGLLSVHLASQVRPVISFRLGERNSRPREDSLLLGATFFSERFIMFVGPVCRWNNWELSHSHFRLREEAGLGVGLIIWIHLRFLKYTPTLGECEVEPCRCSFLLLLFL